MEHLKNQQIPPNSIALVAMSGGVDSSVVAAMLQEQGVRCIGVTMQHKPTGQEQDIADAKQVCQHLNIPHFAINIVPEYERFLEHEIRQVYASGRTPNPCVLCNERMKFGLFFDRFMDSPKLQELLGQEVDVHKIYYASGHYARIVQLPSGHFAIAKAPYAAKDQSYFLYRLNQQQLNRLRFPLGEFEKPYVRELAAKYGLAVRQKPDSQDFCMHSSVLRPTKELPTVLVNKDGKILGAGLGLSHYTIGMRRGLGVSSTTPLYVIAIRPDEREIVLGDEQDLYTNTFQVTQAVHVPELFTLKNISVRIRSMAQAQPALVGQLNNDGTIDVQTEQPQRAITAGQSAVFYADDVVLGGGFIV